MGLHEWASWDAREKIIYTLILGGQQLYKHFLRPGTWPKNRSNPQHNSTPMKMSVPAK